MKRAIVTGGSGLLGQAICSKLIAEDWEVSSFDLCEGKIGVPVVCDISSEQSIAGAFATLGWESLDLLVNNGGWVADPDMRLSSVSLSDWNRMIGSHLTGAFLMSRAAEPLMSEGGAIVMMASTRALMSEGGDFAYAAAKGGMISLAQALAIQLGPRIRVNAIAPGWITDETTLRPQDHAQHPAGRVGRPEDIAEAVLYLARADFVTGHTLSVDGGMTRKMIYEH
ncbi:SDR family NAD(P)-dependent oxidoreductase [Novosphingobium sp. 11B]